MMCPACGSDVFVVLGDLGALRWHRCRQCGTEFHRDLVMARADSDDYPENWRALDDGTD